NRRTAEIEVVESQTKVLLVASGATRDYRFLRNQLQRDRHAEVDVLLQMSPPGISQDANKILAAFPSTKEELFEYDCIVAFDPDWTQLDATQVDMLEQWVAEEAGGMIVVAGPVHTSTWVQSPEHGKIRSLYPVEFQRRLTLLDDGLFGSERPWPIEFTREGLEADFLWIGDTAAESRERWLRFPGVFGCYAVRGPKPGAQVYGRYSDPDAGLSVERPVYFADHFYGAGRVFYMGSGEIWRLRQLDPGYFEQFYTQLVRHVSQGRLLRGSSTGRLLVERDRYFVGDTVVVRAQLSTASREPYVADRVMARVTEPDGDGRNVELVADASRPGNFVGQFSVASEGSFRIELSAPDAPDEQLVKRITATVPDLEFEETRRNEALLKALAASTGGRYYASPQLAVNGDEGLRPAAELLESRAQTKILRGKPDERFAESLNRWLLGIICGALSLEWLIRRLSKLA
ncbi:MAG TPA: VWA domain-containing protein, partial [Lacipirellula sp.]